jgi:hypothetical protein
MRLRILAVAIAIASAPMVSAQSQIVNPRPAPPRVAATHPIQRLTVAAQRENQVRGYLDRASADIRDAQAELTRLRLLMSTWNVESNDRIGNFEVAGVMSTVNENETLASDLQRKIDDLRNGLRDPN